MVASDSLSKLSLQYTLRMFLKSVTCTLLSVTLTVKCQSQCSCDSYWCCAIVLLL